MFFPRLNVCLLSESKKQNSVYFSAAVPNAAMPDLGSQSLEWNPGAQVRQWTISRIALGKAETRPSCQDWERGRCSWEDISSEILQWNLSSHCGVTAAAKPSLSIWAPQLEILHWKQTTHFCCVKVLKCVRESLCVCVCVRVSFEMRGIKGGGWLSSAPYLSPSYQQHRGQNMLSQRRHRVKSLLSWKGINSVPIVTLTFEQKATPKDRRLQENKEKKKN